LARRLLARLDRLLVLDPAEPANDNNQIYLRLAELAELPVTCLSLEVRLREIRRKVEATRRMTRR
jgi:hypothetical protein